MSGRWSLPPLWFDLCWEIGGFDEYPFPIAVPSHGETVEERALLRQRVLPEMRSGGLISGETLAPEFARVLTQIAKPGLWVEGLWMPDDVGPSPVRLLSIVYGNDSILLVQSPGETEAFGGDLRISVHPGVSVGAAAVQGMPPAQPGNKPRVAVPRSMVRGEKPADDDFGAGSMMESAGPPTRQDPARPFRELVDAPHLRDGQFTVNLRDRTGRQRRSEPLHWFDAAEPYGRYGLSHQRRSGYEPEVVVAPLGPTEIRSALEARVAGIRS